MSSQSADSLKNISKKVIHSFADDSTLHHSYKFNKRPTGREVEVARGHMMDSLSSDIRTIMEWGRQNRVEFNLGKTQSCRFSHKRSEVATSLSFISGELQENSNLKMPTC